MTILLLVLGLAKVIPLELFRLDDLSVVDEIPPSRTSWSFGKLVSHSIEVVDFLIKWADSLIKELAKGRPDMAKPGHQLLGGVPHRDQVIETKSLNERCQGLIDLRGKNHGLVSAMVQSHDGS